MTDRAKCWAVIPAAGIGTRMQATLPKQYLRIAGHTVLEHALAPFLQTSSITAVMLALHPQDEHFKDLTITGAKVKTTVGGETRAQSVFNALQALLTDPEDSPQRDDFVLVHDAARPCLTRTELERLIAIGQHAQEGCILAAPLQDTVKQVCSDHIQTTLDRSQLWRALTPQMFRFHALHQALLECLDKGVAITDEASALEHMGVQPRIVSGDSRNLKVTTADDLRVAEIYLQEMQQRDD